MDKTIKINLAGVLFQIEEDAYHLLRDYLQAVNFRFRNAPGGNETIEDIESRIAEIFQSQQSLAGVISKENVEAMIGIIGKPEDFDHSENPAGQSVPYNQKRHLFRNPEDSIISGVCGGLGAYLNTEPVLFRILFVLFTLFFGVGFFIYIALWIALPSANNDSRKREMHGDAYQPGHSQTDGQNRYSATNAPLYETGHDRKSTVGNAVNEVFRAIWRVCYIVVRIILIIAGVALVLTGFLAILCFVMVFVFKYPGIYSTDVFDMHLIYFPDFLNYIVNPVVVPWIILLTLIAIILPMLALIYWGVKMIFWFKAKDGVFSLIGFVLWILTLTALAIILFNEGIRFTETARFSTRKVFSHPCDTLYIKTSNKITELKYDKKLSLDNERYIVFISDEKKEIYIRPYLNINYVNDEVAKVEVRKRSSGRSEIVASKKAEELIYDYRINGDTLLLDEYFTIPSGHKWAADNIGIYLTVRKGTILRFDSASETLLTRHSDYEFDEDPHATRWRSGHSLWKTTDGGIKEIDEHYPKLK
jgi:phage shock protein PspC (stress-responsive transcriptional regulator)